MTFTGGCRETEGGRCAHRTMQTHPTSPDSASGLKITVTEVLFKTICEAIQFGSISGIYSYFLSYI